jgi:hypothetical protein
MAKAKLLGYPQERRPDSFQVGQIVENEDHPV